MAKGLEVLARDDETTRPAVKGLLPCRNKNKNLVTSKRREVDICEESDSTGHQVVVGIECRAWKRP